MKRSVIAFLITVVIASFAIAQDSRISSIPFEPALTDNKMLCPFPETITISGGTVAAPVLADFPPSLRPLIAGAVWNQTVADKAFGHTFRYPAANANECCAITGGRLVLHVKALQPAIANGAAAWNDSANAYSGGVAVGQVLMWQPTGASVGTNRDVTIPLAASVLTSGLLSVYVQDDTAVVSAELLIDRCCVNKRCIESTVDLRTGSNDGAAIPIGASDPHWTVQPPAGGVAPAKSITQIVPWVTPPTGSRWISSSPSAGALGVYVYKFNFDLGKELPGRECTLKLQYAVDNDVTMKIDNNASFETLSGGVLSQHFTMLHSAGTVITPAVGPHVLTVNVNNTSGPTGLVISGRITCVCKHL